MAGSRAGRLLLVALLVSPRVAAAQEPDPLPRGWSAYITMGASRLPGSTPLGTASPAGSLGLAYERPWTTRLTWRAELGYGAVMGDGGPAPALFSERSTLQVPRTHVGLSVRRYNGRRTWVASGATVAFQGACWVDVAGGLGVTGTSSIDCPDFTDRAYESAPVTANLTFGAGLELGRVGLAVRAEQGVTPTVRVDGDGQRVQAIGAELSFRFGRAARGAAAPPRGARATPPLDGQVAAGGTGWAIGAAAGLLLGGALARDDQDWGAPFLGAVAVAPIGTTIAIHAFGRARGLRSNPLATFGGAVAGMFGGPAMWVTSPLGAAVAYNAFSRERVVDPGRR